MKKMLKLPLFLGICGTTCAAILAGVYSLTSPIIASNEEKKANINYYEMFADYGNSSTLTISKDETVTSSLIDAGVTVKAKVTGGSLNEPGYAYTCTTSGFAGKITFQIAFAEGKYLSFKCISHQESKPVAIENMNTYIKDLSAEEMLSTNTKYVDSTSGASVTGKALSGIIDKCASDYNDSRKENQ